MSMKIATRTSTQCHNHHQKMMRRYGGLDNLYQYILQKKSESNLSSIDYIEQNNRKSLN